MKKWIFQTGLVVAMILVIVGLISFNDKNQQQPGYKILTNTDLNGLASAVKNQFQFGYTCAGGVSSFIDKDKNIVFMQAVQK